MDYNNLTICIPSYNEAKSIGKVLTEIRESLPDAEIIVVNDGSSDDTEKIACSIEGVTVISHNRNIGYGGAIKTAIRNSTREVVVWYDADGQHNPEDLKKVARPVLNGEKDLVIGVRDETSDKVLVRIPGKNC
jgi:glycosyltransferase involved in cell wall biosynthesis